MAELKEKNIYISSLNPKCVTCVVVQGKEIQQIDVQVDDSFQQKQKKSTIYSANVESVTPHLNAGFVKLDNSSKNGFLPFAEIAPEHYWNHAIDAKEHNIKTAVKEGQNLLVQVLKEERGTKGAAVTTFITLPGCYLVLLPNNPAAGGISRQVVGEERDKLKNIVKNLKIPSHMGLILRTASTTRTEQELQWELDILLYQWKKIQEKASSQSAPALIYEEGDIYLRTIRDYLKDANSIVVDTNDAFNKITQHLKVFREDFIPNVKLYSGNLDIFTKYKLDHNINALLSRNIVLQNGASIVVDQTEALTAIDVNSARANKGSDIEETAKNTNLEAARKIASLIKVLKISGLIVIDFIDMEVDANKKAVEKLMHDALADDKVKNHVGNLSEFCTLQISRQREGAPVAELLYKQCPVCNAPNACPNDAYASTKLLAAIHNNMKNKNSDQINIYTSHQFAFYLLNMCRETLYNIENNYNVRVVVSADSRFAGNNFSFEEITKKVEFLGGFENKSNVAIQANNVPSEHNNKPKKYDAKSSGGLFSKIYRTFFGTSDTKARSKSCKPRSKYRKYDSNKSKNYKSKNNSSNKRKNKIEES